MIRVLWTVNLIPSELSDILGNKGTVLGGWVEAMADRLKVNEEITLAMACKSENTEQFKHTVGNITYYSLGYSSNQSCEDICRRCDDIISDFHPDIIQVEGTEFLHAKAMLISANAAKIKSVVSLQGILNGQYRYQCGQLPIDDMFFSKSLTDIFAAWILHLRKTRWFKPRMKTERDTLSLANAFLGRTTWDKAHAYAINPDAEYFSCSRVLREPFYHTEWSADKAEPHSIYVGNGYFALKGLHFVLDAMPLLLREYPDLKLYVAGYKPYEENDRRPLYKRGYAAYLQKKVKDLKLENHIVITGPLNAEAVADRLSKVSVYVLASAVENSPNTLGEAMTVGTPCVAAYVGGVPDMAQDGKEALFYRNDDAVLLAWQVKRIFDSAELAKTLSENGKLRARKTHNADKNAEILFSVYKKLTENAK